MRRGGDGGIDRIGWSEWRMRRRGSWAWGGGGGGHGGKE